MGKPSLVFAGLLSHHRYVPLQINVLSEPSETCLPVPESYDKTGKESRKRLSRLVGLG